MAKRLNFYFLVAKGFFGKMLIYFVFICSHQFTQRLFLVINVLLAKTALIRIFSGIFVPFLLLKKKILLK